MISISVQGMLTMIMQETLTTMGCLHIIPSIGELELDFTVYCRFVDNRSRVYGHDRGHKGRHLASMNV